MQAAELRKKGIDKIICATVAPYAEMKQWASKLGDDKHEVHSLVLACLSSKHAFDIYTVCPDCSLPASSCTLQ